MTVWFVGAGPGAPDLLTRPGQRLLAEAPVCLYAGSLVPAELLDAPARAPAWSTPPTWTSTPIIAELVAAHRDGHDVVRLHCGDPSIFSAVAEQARRLDQAGVPWRVVPGVPAFAAAAAALGQELTLPGVGQTVVLTRTAARATPMPAGEELATLGATALHPGAAPRRAAASSGSPPTCCPTTGRTARSPWSPGRAGRTRSCSAAPLGELAERVRADGIRRTAIIVVGEVLGHRGFRDSHLYSAARAREPRR